MRAIVIHGTCKAEDLRVADIPIPQGRPGWVVIRIHAAGMNHSEAILRLYEADREYIHTPIVPGIECAGEVVDPSDTPLQVGDRVIALMGGMGRSFDGSYAEYAVVPAACVFKADLDLDWLSLAAIPESYYTAFGSLRQCLLLTAADTLMVRGATSTVGQAAIQLAKALGATVAAAVTRNASFQPMRALGADECVIDDEHLADHPFAHRPNKVLELVGPRTLHDSLLTVSRPGIVCSTGILGNQFTVDHFDPIKYIPNGVFLSGFYSNNPTQQSIDQLLGLIRDHHIQPLYNKVFALDDIVEAHTWLERGGAGGKMILNMDPNTIKS